MSQSICTSQVTQTATARMLFLMYQYAGSIAVFSSRQVSTRTNLAERNSLFVLFSCAALLMKLVMNRSLQSWCSTAAVVQIKI